jgi:hypothetical protein
MVGLRAEVRRLRAENRRLREQIWRAMRMPAEPAEAVKALWKKAEEIEIQMEMARQPKHGLQLIGR